MVGGFSERQRFIWGKILILTTNYKTSTLEAGWGRAWFYLSKHKLSVLISWIIKRNNLL